MPTMNGEWHRLNPMPRNVTLEQRLEWHREHASACGCREIPRTVLAELKRRGMTIPRRHAPRVSAADFRRIALSFDGAEEGSHMGAADFRVGGHIFATLASVKQGYGNLMLTPEIQSQFIEDAPDVFLPIAGGWGRMGMTHIRLAKANRDVLTGALRTAWKLRVEKNAAARSRARRPRTQR